MTDSWSLELLLGSVNKDMQTRLEIARKGIGHPTDKGDASEGIWLELLQTYLPRRYDVRRAHVVDSNNSFSEQIDIVIHDRQYSPFVWSFGGVDVVPAESGYAVMECKQELGAGNIRYAAQKVESVRKLHRTSLPVPTISGVAAPKPLHHILGGLLTLESNWSPPLGKALESVLAELGATNTLDIGCAVANGVFERKASGWEVSESSHAAGKFLFALIARLQDIATVPMLDVRAYARWLR